MGLFYDRSLIQLLVWEFSTPCLIGERNRDKSRVKLWDYLIDA